MGVGKEFGFTQQMTSQNSHAFLGSCPPTLLFPPRRNIKGPCSLLKKPVFCYQREELPLTLQLDIGNQKIQKRENAEGDEGKSQLKAECRQSW
jgi:hypothetical protein